MEYDEKGFADQINSTKEPLLGTSPCNCGKPDCDRVLIAMIRPRIAPFPGTDELACLVELPIGAIDALIISLLELKREKLEAMHG